MLTYQVGQKIKKKFDFVLHILSFLVAAGSEGSSETAQRISAVSPDHSLLAYVTNNIKACAGSFILIVDLSISLD